jgi:hypothetical protein
MFANWRNLPSKEIQAKTAVFENRDVIPRAVFTKARIMMALDEQQKKLITPSTPLLVILCGGLGLFRQTTDHAQLVENTLKKAYPGPLTDSLDIRQLARVVKSTSAKINPHAAPWIHIVRSIHPDLQAHLRHLQTFAADETTAFHFVHPDDFTQLWVYLQLLGDHAIRQSTTDAKEALETILLTLWNDPPWRRLAETAMLNRTKPTPGNAEDRLAFLLLSFNITFREGSNRGGNNSNYYLLTGEPASDVEEHNIALIEYMKTMEFHPGLYKLKASQYTFVCNICKAEDHQHNICPIPKIENRTGPQSSNPKIEGTADAQGFRPVRGRQGNESYSRGRGSGRGSRRGGYHYRNYD